MATSKEVPLGVSNPVDVSGPVPKVQKSTRWVAIICAMDVVGN